MSPLRMPSSMARPARYGGTRAAPVASSNATKISATPTRYGRRRRGTRRALRAGAGDALPLAARERQSALADLRRVAVGQPRDEVVDARAPRRGLDLVVARIGPRVRDVLADRRGEEEGLIRDEPDLAPQRGQV